MDPNKPLQFIKRETKPQEIEIAGIKYPAIYNFNAISTMEDYTETAHGFTLSRFSMNIYTAKEFIGCLCGMLSAAGVMVDADALAEGINPDEEQAIFDQMMKIIREQSPKPDNSKNVQPPESSTGTN